MSHGLLKSGGDSKTYVFDSFHRDDISSGLEMSDSGHIWGFNLGTFGIQSNKAYLATPQVGFNYQVIDVGVPDCVLSTQQMYVPLRKTGFILRFVDSNSGFILVTLEGTAIKLETWDGEAYDVLLQNSFTAKEGTSYRLEAVLIDNHVFVYLDGIMLLSYEGILNSGVTTHGLFYNHTEGDTPASTWSDFTVASLKDIDKDLTDTNFNLSPDTLPTEKPNNEWNVGYSYTIYSDDSNHSLRLELRSTDANVNGTKCVGIYKPVEDGPVPNPLVESWYGFRVFIPAAGDEAWVLSDADGELLTQWKNTPDRDEETVYPALALGIGYGYDHYRLAVCSDPGEMSTNAILDANGYPHYYGFGNWENDRGHWVELIFHMKWGWLEEHNPLIEVWRKTFGVDDDFVKELTITEPNYFNDERGCSWRLGIYKPQWAEAEGGGSQVSTRVLYYDKIWMK